MDPSLVVLIVFASLITLVGFPWVLFWGVARLREQKAGGGQLRRSDLEVIVRGAVEDANEPVLQRLDSLEAIVLAEEQAQSRIDAAVLADTLDLDDIEETTGAPRRRERS